MVWNTFSKNCLSQLTPPPPPEKFLRFFSPIKIFSKSVQNGQTCPVCRSAFTYNKCAIFGDSMAAGLWTEAGGGGCHPCPHDMAATVSVVRYATFHVWNRTNCSISTLLKWWFSFQFFWLPIWQPCLDLVDQSRTTDSLSHSNFWDTQPSYFSSTHRCY